MNAERISSKAGALKFVAVLAAVAMAVVMACGAFVPQALANKQMTAPTTVSDDITRLHVSKLDADTHEYVEGATMAIIEKATGNVVDEWTTGKSTHQNEKGLDVDKVYILRELAAPEGFTTVEDVEFVVNATEGTGITILSKGEDCELTESYKVNLYDKALSTENEIVVTRTQGGPTNDNGSRTVAPKTGDETPMWLVGALVLLGALAIGVLEIPKRRMKE